MRQAKTTGIMSLGLARVAERVRKDPATPVLSLSHHITRDVLEQAFSRIRNTAAAGVDGITKDQYGANLKENLKDLHARLKANRYRHQPIRRVHIEKDGGGSRPLGVSTVEDKVVQGALYGVLAAMYEQEFLDCSFGFRPHRGCHDALRALDRAAWKGEIRWVLEFDIKSFFDSLDRPKLREMLQERIADKSFLRLVGKCLHVGILDGEEFSRPEVGTTQGSVLSPILGNIYLHHVIDQWFEHTVKPTLTGPGSLFRYADDGVLGFANREDAERVHAQLEARLAQYGLQLSPEKTRLVDFRSPATMPEGHRPETFDFLGFTIYLRQSRRGRWYMACKTRRARQRRAITSIADWCRRYRHLSVKDQHAALTRRIQGHFNYFGVNGNIRCLTALIYMAERAWYKWLNRRSQRSRLTWKSFRENLLPAFPLPRPRIMVQLWGH